MTSTILLVDDEPYVTEGLCRTLHKEPYRILTARSGFEALDVIRDEPVSLVIADQEMPGMTGIELLAHIAQTHPEIVRFVLTGHASLPVAMKAINDGSVARFLTKPCIDVELRAAIRHALKEKELLDCAKMLLAENRQKQRVLAEIARANPSLAPLRPVGADSCVLDEMPRETDALIEEIRKELQRDPALYGADPAAPEPCRLDDATRRFTESRASTRPRQQNLPEVLLSSIFSSENNPFASDEGDVERSPDITPDDVTIGVAMIGSDLEVLAFNRWIETWFPGVEIGAGGLCFRLLREADQSGPCDGCPVVQSMADGQIHESIVETEIGRSVRALRLISIPVQNLFGGGDVVVELIEDITQRLVAEHALREAKQKAEEAGREQTELNEALLSAMKERSRLTAQLEAAKQDAERSNTFMRAFLANLSHEIRTPLNAIVGMTRLLMESSPTDEQAGCLTVARRSADALLAMINDILDVSRIESGTLHLENDRFALADVIESVCEVHRPEAEAKGLDYECVIDPDVPAEWVGDPARLRRVLLHLTGNAVKFTDSGSITVRVRHREATGDRSILEFEVTDNGVGIPPDRIGTIFDSFVQGEDRIADRKGGTGVGLAISRQLVELMGGTIGVDNREGGGSVFRFTVRLRRAEAADAENDDDAQEDAADDDRPAGSVLIVGGSGTERVAVRSMLIGRNLNVYAIRDIDLEAVLRNAEDPARAYDVVLLCTSKDVDDDLARLTDTFRRAGCDPVPVVLIATDLNDPAVERLADRGVVDRAARPIDPADLVERIGSALRRVNATAADTDDPDGTEAPESPGERTGRDRSGVRLLIAEDNRINQIVFVRTMEKQGIVPEVVENGREAVDAVFARPYDLVFMDMRMPVMDGLDATREIRRREAETGGHVPIVALTANAMKEDRETCLDSGMDEYLSKPVQVDRILEMIDRFTSDAPRDGRASDDRAAERRDGAGTSPTKRAPDDGLADAIRSRLGGDADLIRDLVGIFTEDAPETLRALEGAVNAGDADRVGELAHSLKGSAGNLGFAALADAMLHIERLCKAGDLTDAGAAVREARELLEGAEATFGQLGGG